MARRQTNGYSSDASFLTRKKEQNMSITRRRFLSGLGATAISSNLSMALSSLDDSALEESLVAEPDTLYAKDFTGDGVYQLSLNMRHGRGGLRII